MIKKYFVFTMEGALYGFIGGVLLWISLYSIYQTYITHLRSQRFDRISMSFIDFPVKLWGLCLGFMLLGTLIRLIMGIFFQKYNHLYLSWLVTGAISIVVINFMLIEGPVSLIPEIVGYGGSVA